MLWNFLNIYTLKIPQGLLKGGFCYTPCNPIPELRLNPPHQVPLVCFRFVKHLCYFLLFLFLVLAFCPFVLFRNSAYPTLTLFPNFSVFPKTLVLPCLPNLVTPSRTYSSPLLRSLPCTASVVIKVSHQCKVESVQILTKFDLLAH